mmetsp:Transcript_25824/g.25101  ORF Transcript_25824/g.25101 Transcript_25824/m.25101 type:complete len:104 (-) Transcript_25824:146-457(-)|eukprot:CAMPEP_0170541436 /NCGR_PEP_ID=MMETSP0211-20121228/1164_1 /TAXON_ID=311385 /ORGANISM="Pseudokeronopsis sp., Strain OXSARD2" /LENGTH=103 /DNA_ID=CAMNT_0010844151 /DNA_START=961 /DNA_END=1272 /DNA_ORIENTATION=+
MTEFSNLKNERKQSLLIALAQASRVAMIDEVCGEFRDNIDPNLQDNLGNTAFHYAIENLRSDCASRLIEYFKYSIRFNLPNLAGKDARALLMSSKEHFEKRLA